MGTGYWHWDLSILIGTIRGSAEGIALLDYYLVLGLWIFSLACRLVRRSLHQYTTQGTLGWHRTSVSLPLRPSSEYTDSVRWCPGTPFDFRLRDALCRLFGCSYVGRMVTCVGGELEFPQGEATQA